MSEDYQRIEVITGAARRRRWTTEEKLRIVDERRQPRALRLQPAEHGAEHRIPAQIVMIDQVLVAERDAEQERPREGARAETTPEQAYTAWDPR